MGQDREGFAFAVLVGKPVEVFFPWLIAFEEERGRFAEGPLEMGIADLFAASAGLFSVGLLGAFDEPAVGDEILNGGEAMDVFDLIEDDKAQDPADAGNGLE